MGDYFSVKNSRLLRNIKRKRKFDSYYKVLKKIHQSEEKYEFLFNNTNDAIFYHDSNYKFIEVNDVACCRLGYSRAELLQMTVHEIDDPEQYPLDPEILKMYAQQDSMVMEMVHQSKDGNKIPVELSLKKLEINGEKMVLTIARDIRERKRAEERERENLHRLEQLYKEAQEKALQIEATNEIVRVISSSLDFEEILKVFTLEISKLISLNLLVLSLLDHSGRLLIYALELDDCGNIQVNEVSRILSITEPYFSVMKNDCPIIIHERLFPSIFTGESFDFNIFGVTSYICLPLNYKGNLVGTFTLGSCEENKYQKKDLELLIPMGKHLGVAVQNARLHERVHEMAIVIERSRIAREIHDSTLQIMGYFRAKGELVEKLIHKGMIKEAYKVSLEIQEVANEQYNEAREAIHALSESIPEGQSLVQAVKEYLIKINRRWQIITQLIETDNMPPLKRDVELQLMRIIQEALENVRKHAGAKHVWVRFQSNETGLIIEIEDDGCGFDLDCISSNSFGLKVMEERASGIGGHFLINSHHDLGTLVKVSFNVR